MVSLEAVSIHRLLIREFGNIRYLGLTLQYFAQIDIAHCIASYHELFDKHSMSRAFLYNLQVV